MLLGPICHDTKKILKGLTLWNINLSDSTKMSSALGNIPDDNGDAGADSILLGAHVTPTEYATLSISISITG